MPELEIGLVLVVFRAADWPWEPVRPGVTADNDEVLVVGTRRRGPKQPIKPLPEEWQHDGPPLYRDTPRFVLEEAHVGRSAPHLVPLELLQAKDQAQFSGRYAGRLGEDSFKFAMFIEDVFFKGEDRGYGVFPIHDNIVRKWPGC